MPEPPSLHEIEEHLKTLTAPLRVELEQLDAAIAVNRAQHLELIGARKRIRGVLNQITPTAERQKTTRSRRQAPAQPPGRSAADKRNRMLAFVHQHATDEILQGGFTATDLIRLMNAENGAEPIGIGTAKTIVDEMHTEGLIVLDRIGRGGNRWYRPLGGSVQ